MQIRPLRSDVAQTVSTDREGQFRITGLQPVDYGVYASKPAYLSGRPEPRTRPYRIGDTVTLTLIKGGVITGKVLDANGEPVAMVIVQALMVRTAEGQAYGGSPQARSTDDRGVYRIYGLQPGTYVVFAGGPGQSTWIMPETVYQFDVPTYAPSSTREAASEISVRLGEEVNDVDIRYRGEQGRIISGDITTAAKSHAWFSVMLTTGGQAGFQWGETSMKSEDKRGFVFKGIADGEYSLIAQSSDAEDEYAISESKRVTVQGQDVTGIQLTTKLMGSVSGRVVLEETKVAECNNKETPLSTETLVFARPRDEEAAKQIPQAIRSKSVPVRPDDKGDFRLRNLPPGSYYFDPSLRARQWYVRAITFGPPTTTTTTNATTKPKQVDATRVWTAVKMDDRLSGLTITLAQGAATLRGQYELAQGEKAPAGSSLYLVPAERENANDVLRFFATTIYDNGAFELNNIAPGRYWVLAQMGGEDSSTKVRLPLETETRARIRRLAEAAKTEIEFKPCQDILNFRLPLKPRDQ